MTMIFVKIKKRGHVEKMQKKREITSIMGAKLIIKKYFMRSIDGLNL